MESNGSFEIRVRARPDAVSSAKGRYATGTGSVVNGIFKGKATVPPSGSKPGVAITFKAKKT